MDAIVIHHSNSEYPYLTGVTEPLSTASLTSFNPPTGHKTSTSHFSKDRIQSKTISKQQAQNSIPDEPITTILQSINQTTSMLATQCTSGRIAVNVLPDQLEAQFTAFARQSAASSAFLTALANRLNRLELNQKISANLSNFIVL